MKTLAVRFVVATVVVVAGQSAMAQQPQGDGPAFALHAGPAYARVSDADFEVVGSLSGQDLFAQTSAREGGLDFGVFVSQRLWTDGNGGPRLYATVGTGVSRPGRIVYLGGSVGVSRALFTIGLATGLAENGVQAVPDPVFPTTQERTLFGGLERTRQWGLLVSASIVLAP